jgi:hypothetical protein
MKNILVLLVSVLSLTSCVNDVQKNTPALQAKFNNNTWRATQANVEVVNGALVITAFTLNETVILQTSSINPGTYVLGTTNSSNSISYSKEIGGVSNNFETSIYAGPVYTLSNVVIPGNGYVSSSNLSTTGGSGSGLRLNVVANATGGLASVSIVARGEGYVAGDVLNIVQGIRSNATIRVVNVQQSNGEIVIEEVQNGAFTGSFKFNAVDSGSGEVVTFSNGVFYQLSAAGL